jgi:hypothetical protein
MTTSALPLSNDINVEISPPVCGGKLIQRIRRAGGFSANARRTTAILERRAALLDTGRRLRFVWCDHLECH